MGLDKYKGPLAQAVEHLTFNQVVSGSSPEWLKTRKSLETLMFQGFFHAIGSGRSQPVLFLGNDHEISLKKKKNVVK